MEIVTLFEHQSFIPLVAGWLYDAFIRGIRPGISLDDLKGYLAQREQAARPLTYLGLVDSQCIGTISLVRNDLPQRSDLTPWLAALYIDKVYRGQGYAQGLIDAVIETARELGYQHLYLRTETAGGYYRRLGWQKIDETLDQFGLFTEVFAVNLSRQSET